MSRKHFEAIASELLRQRPNLAEYQSSTAWERGAYDSWATIVIGLAGTLRAFNPSFDRGRFLAACGLDR